MTDYVAHLDTGVFHTRGMPLRTERPAPPQQDPPADTPPDPTPEPNE